MLPQQYRLRRSADVRRVRRQGRRWFHPLVILLARKNDQEVSRFAFVAGRRVGKAVKRNRAKRLLREAVRLHLDQLEMGWDCVLIARSSTPQATYADVETAVLQLCHRSGLMRNGEQNSSKDS